MTSVETQVFELLDEYSKERHRCFLSEMFANASKTSYTLCFRPIGQAKDSSDRFMYRYLHIEIAEIKAAADQGALTAAVIDKLDKGLSTLERGPSA